LERAPDENPETRATTECRFPFGEKRRTPEWTGQKTVAVTIFAPSDVFATLSTIPFAETSPLARALRSVIIEPDGFNLLNQNNDLTFRGFTADVPGIQAKPLQLSIDNLLLLGSLTAQFEQRLEETNRLSLQVRDTLEQAIRNEDRNLRNRADDILESSLLAQVLASAEQTGILEDVPDEIIAVPRFLDFTRRATEAGTFGATYSAVARDGALGSAFISGTSLAAGDRVVLSDLLIGSQSATATNYAVFLTSELGGDASATLLDAGLNPVANGTVISAAELSTFSVQASSGGFGALDYLSIVELRDDGLNGTFEGRGAFRTIAVNSSTEAENGAGGANGVEQLRTYDFFTASGTAYTQIRLDVSGVNSLGFTNALDAINGGALRVKVGETLIDGSVNVGQVDRSQSNGDTIVIVFPFQAAEDGLAQNGLDVEIRALDDAFDISTITVRAEFP
jgi:hypothetical protein